MNKQSLWMRTVRATTILAIGGSAFQLSGCDPEIRDTLLSGLEATTTEVTATLIAGFFEGWANNDSDSNG